MTTNTADADRARLIDKAKRFWALLRTDGADSANRMTDESDAIVAEWRARDSVSELLEPLLDNEDVEIRYMSAAYLASIESSDRAYSILEEIGAGEFGAVSASAHLLVMMRHQR